MQNGIVCTFSRKVVYWERPHVVRRVRYKPQIMTPIDMNMNHRRSSSAAASPAMRQRVVGGASGNINIKALSRAHTSAQWKETLRKGCLERVKLARMERLRKSRLLNVSVDDSVASSSAASTNPLPMNESCGKNNNRLKRGRNEELEDVDWSGINEYKDVESIIDRTHWAGGCNSDDDSQIQTEPSYGQTSLPLFEMNNPERHGDTNMKEDYGGGEEEEMGNVVETARALVEQELQRAISGMQQCRELVTRSSRARDANIDYSISHEEFLELLNDVTEELQREGVYLLPCVSFPSCRFDLLTIPFLSDELLEEEIWEMERAEAMERERLMHQIDDYESWEELEKQQHSQPSTYTSPFQSLDTPLLTCPICNLSNLMESPQHGIICSSLLGHNPPRCTFQLNIAHEGLTLFHLQNQLTAIYEEHSQLCLGRELVFHVENRAGVSMLMAKCNVCSSDVVVL